MNGLKKFCLNSNSTRRRDPKVLLQLTHISPPGQDRVTAAKISAAAARSQKVLFFQGSARRAYMPEWVDLRFMHQLKTYGPDL
jgi:hypothetical protein